MSNDTPQFEGADLVIVGGGAAGLAAGIFATQAAGGAKRIVILDSAKSLGAKILVSGGGRCNVTHDEIRAGDFNGSPNIVRNVLAAFDVGAAVRWFASMGVELKREETGKLFPVADSARVVLQALLRRFEELGGVIQCGSRVTKIARPGDRGRAFSISHEGGTLSCDRIIMATGGRSLPRSGSDGSGWEIVKELGHSVTPTYAALAPLVLDSNKMFHVDLAGIALEVELSTFVKGKRIDHRKGSLLWTHFGISGPAVMDASRHWIIAGESGDGPIMRCNLLPGETFESVERWWMELAAERPRLGIGNALSQRLPERAAMAIIGHVAQSSAEFRPLPVLRGRDGEGAEPGIANLKSPIKRPHPNPPPEYRERGQEEPPRQPAAIACGQLSRDARRALVHAMTALHLPIVSHRGWNYAEVTAGGVPLGEIDYRSMESRRVPGLFLAGEMLDCDGRIGGFNFQWAWATGYLAGRAAGQALK